MLYSNGGNTGGLHKIQAAAGADSVEVKPVTAHGGVVVLTGSLSLGLPTVNRISEI